MKLKANEQKEYQEIVEKYSNMVYRLAYFYTNSKYDADDIYQDVFLKYLQNKKQFENEEIKFEMEENIGLYNEIKKLPKKYRVVIHLFYYEQYSVKDISKILKQKESTIRTWLTRARKMLKNYIKEEDFYV